MTAQKSALPPWQIDASRFAVLSRLADDLAHEIKNPLHSMVINLEVLKARAARGDTQAALERAVVLEHEIHKLHALIDGMLRLLRPVRDGETATSVAKVLEELQLIVELRARLAHVEFSPAGLAVDAFTSVPADVLRFALLAVSEQVLDLARQAGAVMWLTAEPTPGEIHFRIGFAGDAAMFLADGQGTVEGSDSLRGISAARTLLEPAGAAVQVDPERCAVLIRAPRFKPGLFDQQETT